MTKTESAYTEDGVDIHEGDSFSAMAGEVCKMTFQNSPFVEVRDFSDGHFRGPRGFRFVNLPESVWSDGAPDGIGTKSIILVEALTHEQAFRDLLAMTGGDITRWGGIPLVFFNVLDVSSLGESGSKTNNAFRRMICGVPAVAREQGLVCFRGETAELGPCVGSENQRAASKFNAAGFMVGAYLEDRMITGSTLAPGQTVVALQENGFRSNGFSTVRAAFSRQFGQKWWNNPEAKTAIQQVARPSTLYDKFLSTMNGWSWPLQRPQFNFHLITHVTGGGIVVKFAEDMLFPFGLSASLHNLFSPSEIMKDVVGWRGMEDEECYRTFGCGNGALVVLDEGEVDFFVKAAHKFGIRARKCGEIIRRDRPTLEIMSGFTGNMLSYTADK
jgi:phosphoribosylformylglycinamidine cyclo-ligase